MADNYLEFSEEIENLTADESAWLRQQLENNHFLQDFEDEEFDLDDSPGFSFEFSENSLWLYTQEWGYADRVAHLVQKFLRTFRPDDSWMLTYAVTCSKPRIGQFGGGAVLVTATEIRYQDAHDFFAAARPRVVVNMQGGVIQDLFCSDPNTDIVVADWDSEGDVEVGNHRAFVARRAIEPISALAGTDVEKAIANL